MSIDKMIKLAKNFEVKIAQTTSAQAADVEMTLQKHSLWDLSNMVGNLIGLAKVPEACAVDINLAVDPTGKVNFLVRTTPAHPSAKTLQNLLSKNLSGKMSGAIKSDKLMVAAPVTLKWLHF